MHHDIGILVLGRYHIIHIVIMFTCPKILHSSAKHRTVCVCVCLLFVCLFVYVFVCLFEVLHSASEFITQMETSPLQVKECAFCSILGAQGHLAVSVL